MDDTSTPPHGDIAAHTAGVSCKRLSCWHRCACTHRRRVLVLHSPSHERLRFWLRTCTLHRRCDGMQAPPTPSRAIAQRTLMAPVRRCSRTSSQRRQVCPCGASGDTACRYERWSVTSARRPLRPAKLWLLLAFSHHSVASACEDKDALCPCCHPHSRAHARTHTHTHTRTRAHEDTL